MPPLRIELVVERDSSVNPVTLLCVLLVILITLTDHLEGKTELVGGVIGDRDRDIRRSHRRGCAGDRAARNVQRQAGRQRAIGQGKGTVGGAAKGAGLVAEGGILDERRHARRAVDSDRSDADRERQIRGIRVMIRDGDREVGNAGGRRGSGDGTGGGIQADPSGQRAAGDGVGVRESCRRSRWSGS